MYDRLTDRANASVRVIVVMFDAHGVMAFGAPNGIGFFYLLCQVKNLLFPCQATGGETDELHRGLGSIRRRSTSSFVRLLFRLYKRCLRPQGGISGVDYSDLINVVVIHALVTDLNVLIGMADLGNASLNGEVMALTIQGDSHGAILTQAREDLGDALYLLLRKFLLLDAGAALLSGTQFLLEAFERIEGHKLLGSICSIHHYGLLSSYYGRLP